MRSRRTVMKAFGEYLDWIDWLDNVKRGAEEPPERDTVADMARGAGNLEERYINLISDFIALKEEKK